VEAVEAACGGQAREHGVEDGCIPGPELAQRYLSPAGEHGGHRGSLLVVRP
jgi:hypothetical protein